MIWGVISPITDTSVSYTHLDVYKRQGYGVINHKDGVEFWFELELFIANNQ